jgi:NAD-dependent dihydropyrimidine dehydrogenase PreA subunit
MELLKGEDKVKVQYPYSCGEGAAPDNNGKEPLGCGKAKAVPNSNEYIVLHGKSDKKSVIMMDVYVDKPKCTGCQHCKDVCPVGVFEMKDINAPDVNSDSAPEDKKWKGVEDQTIFAKFSNANDGHTHYKEKSVAVNGSACILCQACLIECEGECITIIDDNSTKYQSIYK